MKFTKMEGCGNDYVYINCFEEKVEDPSVLAKVMSERHFGIGSDGLVLILPSEKADFRMRMFNADGSESEMCGNAMRCIGKYVFDKRLTQKNNLSVETLAGIKYLKLHLKDSLVDSVTVDMGEPIFEPQKIPVLSNMNPVIGKQLYIIDSAFLFTCMSMGNPHAITFVNDIDKFDVKKYGPIIESHEHFPKKTNVEFVQVMDRNYLKMRVWERGTGETWACGTGTCAAVVATVLNGLCEREADVKLLGGTLHIKWDSKNNHIYMTGPARYSFEGVWLK